MFAGVITKALAESDTITDALEEYNSKPAIFTGGLPDDAKYPAILIEELGGAPWGCRDSKGTAFSADVRVFDNKEFSRKEISDLARNVWLLLDRHDLAPWLAEDGFENWGCTAQFPTFVEDGLNFPGYVVRVTLRVLQAAA